MPAPGLMYQAVILAGGDDKRLYPLGGVKALLPVANKPLLSYPLRTLSEAGLKHAFVVVSGEKPSAAISAWIQTEYPSSLTGLQCEVITVSEDCGTADALRAVTGKISESISTVVVLSGDLLTDVPVNALVASHEMHGALATVMLSPRKTSPASETKPGRPPKNVDYIGLDLSREHLLFYASSPEALRDLKVPLPVVRSRGAMTISSDLVDAHLYVFNRSVLSTLENNRSLTSLRQDLLPFLTQKPSFQQRQLPSSPGPEQMLRQGSLTIGDLLGDGQNGSSAEMGRIMPGANYMDMTHSLSSSSGTSSSVTAGGCRQPSAPLSLRVHVVQHSANYCARVADVVSYGEVNREVADPGTALHLSGLRPTKYDNIVAASTTLGNKTTVAAGCIVGENGVLGDKSSIKRSVLGNGCKLGLNAKIINSVLMDNVVVGDNCTIQNSILSVGVQLKERSSVKDCQLGPGYVVAAGVEYKGEVLAKGTK